MDPSDLPLAEASFVCRGCAYTVYFNHGGDGTSIYSCDDCGHICAVPIVPFYFRNPSCPGCERVFEKQERIPTAHMRASIDTIPCPKCKGEQMDMRYHMDASFYVKGHVPDIGQTIHANVIEVGIFEGEPYLFIPDLASGHYARVGVPPDTPLTGNHRFRVDSIQKGHVKPGDLRIITVTHLGPIADDEMWNNDAPL